MTIAELRALNLWHHAALTDPRATVDAADSPAAAAGGNLTDAIACPLKPAADEQRV
jgi:hypothetical protein